MPINFIPATTEKSRRLPLYLTSLGYDYTERFVDRPEGYNDFQWLQTSSGQGEIILSGKTYPLTPDSGVFLYPGDPHLYHPTTDLWQTEWLTFNGKNAAAIIYELGFHKSGLYHINDQQQLSHTIRQGYLLSSASGEYRDLDTAGFLFNFLIQIRKHAQEKHSPTMAGQYQRLAPIMTYLDTHFSEPLALDMLAAIINVSPQYLCTLFKNVTGNRPALHVNQLRINKAKEMMLLHPELTIAHIAKTVGFESPSYFSAVFKKHENQTPGQFISLHRT